MYNRQLETFINVADYGSFTKASEKIFLSGVSVMKQINALEDEIGVKLFERTNHGVILTPAGHSVYEDAKKLISFSNDIIKKARLIAGKQEHIIRVGTSMLRPCKELMDLWRKIDDGNLPFTVEVSPFEDDPKSMDAMLENLGKKIDCFVGPYGSIEWMKRFNIHLLGYYNCCIALSRKHRLAKKDRLTLEDMYGESLLLVKRSDAVELNRLRDEIEKNHPQIHIVNTPHFYDVAVFNECEQKGYLMETLDIWKEVHPSLVTLPVDWEYKIPYGIVYSKKPSKSMRAFIDAIEYNIK